MRVLLRLLLSLCLLVDIVGPAVAATHLGLASLPAQAPAQAGSGCHDAAATHEAATVAASPTPEGGEDCLERCQDLCLQQGAAMSAHAPLPPLVARGGPAMRGERAQVDEAHPLPGLRPPIG